MVDSESVRAPSIGPDLAEVAAEWAPALPVLSQQLGEAAGQIETSVFQVCQSFRGIATRARASAAHAALAMGQDVNGHDAMGEGVQALEALLTRLSHAGEVAQRTVQQTRQLEALGSTVEQIRKSLHEVREVASWLRLLAINVCIEVARSGTKGGTFGVLAEETSKLAQRANTSSLQVGELIEGLHTQITATASHISRDAVGAVESLALARNEARSAFQSLGTSHREMRLLAQESVKGCEEIARNISEAIIGLQFQDAVNQRLGHVIESLDEMSASFSGGADVEGGGSEGDVVRRLLERSTMHPERQIIAKACGHLDVDAGHSTQSIELF